MDNFFDITFPKDIVYQLCGGPTFVTCVAAMQNKIERRAIRRHQPQYKYKILFSRQNIESLEKLMTFFMVCKGRAHSFRFRDWRDYKTANGKLIAVDNANYKFKFAKRYEVGDYAMERIIAKPIKDSIKLISEISLPGYNINYGNGKIEFFEPLPSYEKVRVSFEFDVNVRFLADELIFSGIKNETDPLEIELIEVL